MIAGLVWRQKGKEKRLIFSWENVSSLYVYQLCLGTSTRDFAGVHGWRREERDPVDIRWGHGLSAGRVRTREDELWN